MPPKGKTKQGTAAHISGMSDYKYDFIAPELSANGSLGSGVLCNERGTPVIIDFTAQDTRMVARLQDVEDHPDLVLDMAA